jgi:hypothetical protein
MSADKAKRISSKLASFGFKAIEDEDDAYAGLLTLSRDPEATCKKTDCYDITRRPECIAPLVWASLSLVCLIGSKRNSWLALLAVLLLAVFVWGGLSHLGLATTSSSNRASHSEVFALEEHSMAANPCHKTSPGFSTRRRSRSR